MVVLLEMGAGVRGLADIPRAENALEILKAIKIDFFSNQAMFFLVFFFIMPL